jgi:hypothetical protein
VDHGALLEGIWYAGDEERKEGMEIHLPPSEMMQE